jgi:hypothetical protein
MNRHAVRWELRACHPSMQLKMGRLPDEELVVPELADGFAVAGLDAAADGDDRGRGDSRRVIFYCSSSGCRQRRPGKRA